MTETQAIHLFIGCYAIVVSLLPWVRFTVNIVLQQLRPIAPLNMDYWIRNGRNALHHDAIKFGEYIRQELSRMTLT